MNDAVLESETGVKDVSGKAEKSVEGGGPR